MTAWAAVFLVWAIIATAFLLTQREWGLSQRRLWLDERRTRKQFQKFAKEERLLRIYWEAQYVGQAAEAAAFRRLWVEAAAKELKRAAESNGHVLELVKDEPA